MNTKIEIDLIDLGKYLIKTVVTVAIIGSLSVFFTKKFTNYFDTPIIEYKSPITEKDIIKNTSFSTSNASTRAVSNDINNIRSSPNSSNSKSKLLGQFPEGTSPETIQKEINKLKADIALSEPSADHVGTNIYSIKINKSKHALGIYSGIKMHDSTKAIIGIHYRNGRLAYQVGKEIKGGMEYKIIWEAVQW